MTDVTDVSAVQGAIIGYLGPPGSWTHQAAIDWFGQDAVLLPMTREPLFDAYANRQIDQLIIPVSTAIVGLVPYIDDIMALPEVRVVGEHLMALDYCLLAMPGTRIDQLHTLVAHPVARQEVGPWFDRHLPVIEHRAAASAGAAAREVASLAAASFASVGPAVNADLYGLEVLANRLEAGPHNVTRWWVLGHSKPAPGPRDKTSLLWTLTDETFGDAIQALVASGCRLLTCYERPSRRRLSEHHYLIEIEGHESQAGLQACVRREPSLRILGSYARCDD